MLKLISKTLLLLTCLYCFSCQPKMEETQESQNVEPQRPDHIVLILHHINYTGWYEYASGRRTTTDENVNGVLHYTDSILNKIPFMPTGKIDTLIIPANGRDYVDINYHYKVLENVYFLVKKGDTLDINLDDKEYPKMTSRQFPALNPYINFIGNIPSRISKNGEDGFSVSTLLYDGWNITKNELYAQDPNDFKAVFKEEEFIPLDTLQEEMKAYQITYKNALLQFDKFVETDPKLAKDIKAYKDYYTNLLTYQNILNANNASYFKKDISIDEEMVYSLMNDEEINFQSYQNFVGVLNTIESRRENVALLRFKQGSTLDPRTTFDNILKNKNIPPRSKRLLLRNTFKSMFSNQLDGVEEYLALYEAYTKDSIYVKEQTIKYNLTMNSQHLYIENQEGSIFTLAEVLKQYKGKKVLIDFWATWCAPCIKEIPYLQKYQNENKQNVQVIALSIEDDVEAWKSNEKVKKSIIPQFRILNRYTSQRYKQYQIETIPRYLLFDPKGEIADLNFPRPSTL